MFDPNSPIRPPDSFELPAQPGAIAARFSIDEVAQLATLLGLTPPASVANAVLAVGAFGSSASADDAIAGAVRRGLFARGVIEADPDDRLHMDDDAAAILTTICRPTAVVTVATDRATDRATVSQRRTVYARPGGAVLETSRQVSGLGVMDYLSLPLEAIMPSVVHWTGLDDRRTPLPAGADHPESASAAADHMRARAVHHGASNSVTVVRRAGDQLAVSRTSWNDRGDAGLWLLEEDDEVTFTPIAGPGVLDRLTAILPPNLPGQRS